MNKYNANRSVYDDQVWDSDLELSVYKWLCKVTRFKNTKVALAVKVPIVVKPACNVFKARTWKCDFKLLSADNHINLEVKGFLTRDFKMMFEMFEACNPVEFNRTFILTSNEDVRRAYSKLNDRLIWIPSLTSAIADPLTW